MSAQAGDEATFLASINDQGSGASFDQAVLLSDTADYSLCETLECAQKVFNETVTKNEIKYITQQFGEPQRDWEFLAQGEVTIYRFGDKRYYDDVSIHDVVSAKDRTLHFDITSSVDVLRQKEYALDPSVASRRWNHMLF